MSSPVGRRHVLPLPVNGHDLAEMAAKEFQAELQRYFRPHLTYPNATVKIQWSANFYTSPQHYEGSSLLKITTEGITETQLQEEGKEPEMEMGAIELGIQSAAAPVALTRLGEKGPTTAPSPTESRGRRDINARRGAGIEFMAGGPLDPNLADVGDQSKVQRQAAQAVSDLEVSKEQQPMHESTIVIPAPEKAEEK